MKRLLLAFTVLTVILLSGCQTNTDSLADLGLDNLSSKAILDGLADGSITPDGYAVSVYDDELVVIADDERFYLDMPEDQFYLSVAPFIDQTHECLYHSATGCRGEMKDETFHISLISDSGTVIMDETITSQSNGFIDLWLPRDIEGTLTITYNDLSTSKTITTYTDDKTCETTMQLT
ncbi:MAG: CueP family metal-binding protein [Candidatus Izimaplasma sp.]|nr:CueP family metal-binding protein [Candidatus Izimaplasma bacterium]